MSSRFRRSLLSTGAVLLCATGCKKAEEARPAAPPAFSVYRFDDHLDRATVSAADVNTSTRVTDPIIWKNFLTEKDATWNPLRGFIGIRGGDLIVKGDGGSPVIVSPKETEIDWNLYDTVAVRLMAEGGSEVKIKIGPAEFSRKLGPPKEYRTYRFDIDINAPRGTRPLAIMPTDSPVHLAAISSIELIPRRTSFESAAGRQVIGKREEYRNTIYAHSPSSLNYEVTVPPQGRLKFGIGVAAKRPVTFRILAGPAAQPVFSRTVDDPDSWVDADVDLSSLAGTTARIVFETSAAAPGAVGLWANPLLTTSGPTGKPNILVYLVCSLRPDHTSLYGYTRDTTPHMKQLGAAGAVFENAQAQAPWTKASVPSLMTSLYSYTLGIRHDTDTIPRGATTLAQTLRSAGYVTASIVTNPFVGRASGLDRGYDYISEYPVVHRHRTEAEDRGTDSAALNKVAMPWLEQHRDEPFFLYAHVTDPHAPYRPPKEFEAKFANPAETAQFNRDYGGLWSHNQYGGGTTVSPAVCKQKGVDPETFIRRAKDRYDGEIAFADNSLQKLTGKLKELGILDNTLVVVLSDHGEEFFDHGFTAHGHSLYRELVHTVLMMWNPKLIPAPRRIPEAVQLVDVFPTLVDLAGVKPEGMLQGQSLVPLIQGRTLERKTPVVSSRFAHPNAKPGGTVPENRTGTFAIWEGPWKLLYRDQAKRAGLAELELYDWRSDTAEKANLAAQNPDAVKKLKTSLDSWVEAQEQISKALGPGGKAALDPAALERLRSLGYIGGAAPPSSK